MALSGNEGSWNSSPLCQNQSCSCMKCTRTQKFQKLLNQLTLASTAVDYEERISAIVTMICVVCVYLYWHYIYVYDVE